jgi:hypothetical protein
MLQVALIFFLALQYAPRWGVAKVFLDGCATIFLEEEFSVLVLFRITRLFATGTAPIFLWPPYFPRVPSFQTNELLNSEKKGD